MLAAFVWVLSAGLAVADVRASYEIGVRDELRVRGRTLADVDQAMPVAIDVEVQPMLGGAIDTHRLRLGAAYYPRLIFNEFYARPRPNVLHRMSLDLDWRVSRETRFFANGLFTVGQNDFTSLTSAATTTQTGNGQTQAQPVPLTTRLAYLSAFANAGLSAELNRRARLDISGGYSVSGGNDPGARDILPQFFSAYARVDLAAQNTRRDQFTTTANASKNGFSTGQRYDSLELLETWRGRTARDAEILLALGLSGIDALLAANTPTSFRMYPEAQLQFTQNLLARTHSVQLQLGLALRPFFDRLTARLYERVEANAGVAWTLQSRTSFAVRGYFAGGYPLESAPPSLLASAEATLAHGVNANMAIEVGARALWQRVTGFDQQLPLLWVAFFALNLSDASRNHDKNDEASRHLEQSGGAPTRPSEEKREATSADAQRG